MSWLDKKFTCKPGVIGIMNLKTNMNYKFHNMIKLQTNWTLSNVHLQIHTCGLSVYTYELQATAQITQKESFTLYIVPEKAIHILICNINSHRIPVSLEYKD